MARRQQDKQALDRRSGVRPWLLVARVPAHRQPRPDVHPAHHRARDGRADAVQPKALLAGAAGYLVLGRDLIPDDIPIIGGLDDLVVVVLAAELFLEGVPDDLLDEKLGELGIDRAEFDRDVAQVRRLTPGPVRRSIRRVPESSVASAKP